MVHVAVKTKLYFYPSARGVEYKEEPEFGKKKWVQHTYGFGMIYVVRAGTIVAEYEARGGPKEKFKGEDRHIHSSIPPGDYVLSAALKYTTPNWPNSCIPWGAKIRETSDHEIEYNPGSGWIHATGSPQATMNVAARNLLVRINERPLNADEEAALNDFAKLFFDVDPKHRTGTIVSVWQRNDFGEWAFSLQQGGKKSGFFIHTTPEDELTPKGTAVQLDYSHGCIHMRPVDRNEAKDKGYLQKGAILHVAAFDAKGPPV